MAGLNRASSSGREFSPHAVARDAHVLVGLVLDEGPSEVAQPLHEVRPATCKNRTNDVTVTRIHPSEPAGAGAARQAEQERFGLIVARMAERHDIRAGECARSLEKRIAGGASGVFDGASFAARRPPRRRGQSAPARRSDSPSAATNCSSSPAAARS
jgi:hypothetical protein